MAKLYRIRTSVGGFVEDLVAALQNYYGAGVTIHYWSPSGHVVFNIPAISDKVFRFSQPSQPDFYYGDVWTSGTTITNAVQFYKVNAWVADIGLILILGDSFIFGHMEYSGTAYPFLLGKTTGGSFLVFSYASYGDRSLNVTTGVNVKPVTFGNSFKDGTTGRLYKQQLYFAEFSGALLMNGSSPDTIPGLYAISHPRQNMPIFRQSYMISSARGTLGSTNASFRDQLIYPIYIEYEPDPSMPQGRNPNAEFV